MCVSGYKVGSKARDGKLKILIKFLSRDNNLLIMKMRLEVKWSKGIIILIKNSKICLE